MAYDPTRQVPPPGYAPPQVPPGYAPPQVPPGYPPQQPPGFPPGYAPPQSHPSGYPLQAPPPYSAYSSQPGVPGATGSFWFNLGRPGQGALISALGLLIFFFLPWISIPDFSDSRSFTSTFIPLTTYSGFSTASSITINIPGGNVPSLNFNVFAALWVVPVGAVGLLIIAWLLSQHRITAKAASAMLLVISIAILLVTLAFLLEVNSIEDVATKLFFTPNGTTPPETLVTVSTGFWLGGAAAVVALLTGAYGAFQGGKAPVGVYQ